MKRKGKAPAIVANKKSKTGNTNKEKNPHTEAERKKIKAIKQRYGHSKVKAQKTSFKRAAIEVIINNVKIEKTTAAEVVNKRRDGDLGEVKDLSGKANTKNAEPRISSFANRQFWFPTQFFAHKEDSVSTVTKALDLQSKSDYVKMGNVCPPSADHARDSETKRMGEKIEPLIPTDVLLVNSSTAISHNVHDRSLLFPSTVFVNAEDSLSQVVQGNSEKSAQSKHTTDDLLQKMALQAVTESAADMRAGQLFKSQRLQAQPNPRAAMDAVEQLKQTENVIGSVIDHLMTDTSSTDPSLKTEATANLMEERVSAVAVVTGETRQALGSAVGKIVALSPLPSTSAAARETHKDGHHLKSIIKGEMHLGDILAGNRNPNILIGPKLKRHKKHSQHSFPKGSKKSKSANESQ